VLFVTLGLVGFGAAFSIVRWRTARATAHATIPGTAAKPAVVAHAGPAPSPQPAQPQSPSPPKPDDTSAAATPLPAASLPHAAPVTSAPASATTPDDPGEQLGTINAGDTAGHRVWVDRHLMGQSPATLKVSCGAHEVKIGSTGTPQTVMVPCGGEVSVR
jgi:hypothetical protein